MIVKKKRIMYYHIVLYKIAQKPVLITIALNNLKDDFVRKEMPCLQQSFHLVDL